MSLAKKCDICGKFYEHYETLVDGYPKNAIVLIVTDQECCYGFEDDDAIDCCPDCMKTILYCIDGLKNGAGDESKTTLEKDNTEPYIAENCDNCAFKHLSREHPPCDNCFEYDSWTSR